MGAPKVANRDTEGSQRSLGALGHGYGYGYGYGKRW